MQQYSSLPEQNSQLDSNSSTVLTTVEQLRAELWLERSLNQLQSRLNDCLTLTTSYAQSTASAREHPTLTIFYERAEIFQTVINELNIAFNSTIVAFSEPVEVAIAIVQPQTTVCKICYTSSGSTVNSQATSLAVKVKKTQNLQLKLNTEIDCEDLQQLESQQPQIAFPLGNDSLGIVGWIITSIKGSTDSSK
ncbi:MAG: hybrid sensor histidine kinase/response regulator, partial [Cyanobacteria bacterium J06649_11]